MKSKKLIIGILTIILFIGGGIAIAAMWHNYNELTSGNIADGDDFLIRDISDTSLSANGTQKRYNWDSMVSDLSVGFDELSISDILTTRSGWVDTLKIATTYNPTEDSPDPTTDLFGLYSEISITGAEDLPWSGGGGHSVSVLGHTSHGGTGTVGLIVGVEGAASVTDAGGTATTAMGLSSNLLDGTGTITTWYGVYVADIDTTNITNKYSFYSADPDCTFYNLGDMQAGGNILAGSISTPDNFNAFSDDYLKNMAMSHDNSDGTISTSSGDIKLQPNGGDVIVTGTATFSIEDFLMGRLELTADTSIAEAQLLAAKFITNQGDSGEADLTLPAVSYGIGRIFVVEEAQNIEINPPSGEAFDLDGTTLDANDCIDSDSTVGSKIVATRMKNAAGTWIWSLDTIRGVWTDTGASD